MTRRQDLSLHVAFQKGVNPSYLRTRQLPTTIKAWFQHVLNSRVLCPGNVSFFKKEKKVWKTHKVLRSLCLHPRPSLFSRVISALNTWRCAILQETNTVCSSSRLKARVYNRRWKPWLNTLTTSSAWCGVYSVS